MTNVFFPSYSILILEPFRLGRNISAPANIEAAPLKNDPVLKSPPCESAAAPVLSSNLFDMYANGLLIFFYLFDE